MSDRAIGRDPSRPPPSRDPLARWHARRVLLPAFCRCTLLCGADRAQGFASARTFLPARQVFAAGYINRMYLASMSVDERYSEGAYYVHVQRKVTPARPWR